MEARSRCSSRLPDNAAIAGKLRTLDAPAGVEERLDVGSLVDIGAAVADIVHVQCLNTPSMGDAEGQYVEPVHIRDV